MKIAATFLLATAAAACAAANPQLGRALSVEYGPAGCRLNGQDGDPAKITEAWFAANGRPSDVVIIGKTETPYKCIGAAVFYLQRQHVKHISFYALDN